MPSARSLHALLTCLVVLSYVTASVVWNAAPARAADAVVGTGNPASCTEPAFDTVLNTVQASGGGTITFTCGPALHNLIFTAPKAISAAVELRGDDLIALSGGNTTSMFQVFAAATLTLRTITVTRAAGAYGAIENFGRLDVAASRLDSNTASGSGGAVLNHGQLRLSDVAVTNNSASDLGGGIHAAGGSAVIERVSFGDNRAVNGGGALSVDTGAEATVDGSSFNRNQTSATLAEGGAVRGAGTLTIAGSTFTQNGASRGGALHVDNGTADVLSSVFTGNWAAYGGAVRQESGTLNVAGTAFGGNGFAPNGTKVTTGGGALSLDGGGATVSGSTISGSWASYGGGIGLDNGTAQLTNVTISGNQAVGGGAIDQGGGSLTLLNVTVAGNAAPFFAGGISNRVGTLALTNTLLSGNINPDNLTGSNCNKAVATASFSLSSDLTCGFGAGRNAVDTRLGPLKNNGGATATHLPLPGSPAEDGGTGAGCPPTDQRGVRRPQGQACDVGAVEVEAKDRLLVTFLPLAER